MSENKHYLWIDYHSVDGGVNNLQSVKICTYGVPGYLKCFTSKQDKAILYAKSWAKKNNLSIDS